FTSANIVILQSFLNLSYNHVFLTITTKANMNKKSLLTLGFLAFAWPNTAQEHHHHGPNYEISVFYGTEQQAPINLENKVSIESAVATHFPNWSYSLDPITGVFSHLYGP